MESQVCADLLGRTSNSSSDVEVVTKHFLLYFVPKMIFSQKLNFCKMQSCRQDPAVVSCEKRC